MNHKLKPGFAAGAILSIFSLLAVAANLPERLEYAFGFALGMQYDSEYFSVGIPLEVYRSASDSRLRDVAVFNANGTPVPRIFDHKAVKDEAIENRVPLNIVPFFGREVDQPDQLRVLLRTDENGITLDMDVAEINKQKARAGKGKEAPTSYIIDLRKQQHALEQLEFEFPTTAQGFMGTVLLEDSVDLQYWRTIGSATLAELRHEDAAILQNRVKLNKTITDYLRISWRDMPADWQLKSATGIYLEEGVVEKRQWLELDAMSRGQNGNEFVFDIGGSPPVDRVSVLLPDDNVVVRASIYYRNSGNNDWRRVQNGVFYHVTREGTRFETPPMEIGTTRISEWKVIIDSGVTDGPVKLKLGWRPDNLIFLAQGPGPFELLTGRAQASLEGFPEEKLLGDSQIFDVLQAAGPPGVAALGPRESIAGEQGLNLVAVTDWKKLLLWAGLILAVLIVGKMTLSLLRDLRKRSEET